MYVYICVTHHASPSGRATEIKEMKNEYAEKKVELKKQMKQMLKDDEKKLEAIKKSGQDMIEYLKSENAKLQEKHAAMKHEYSLLEKQFDLLTLKSDEISNNFTSLQGYVSVPTLCVYCCSNNRTLESHGTHSHSHSHSHTHNKHHNTTGPKEILVDSKE